MSDIIGNGKLGGLVAFLENLASKGKVKTSVITPLKSAVKAVFSKTEGESWENVDVRNIDLDDYINRFKNLTIGKYDSSSYGAYRTRVSRAIDWYSNFLQNPGWSPSVNANSQKDKQSRKISKRNIDANNISEGEVVLDASEPSVNAVLSSNRYNTAMKLISFPFPMSNGVIATLYLPQDICQKDADRLKDFVQTLVIGVES